MQTNVLMTFAKESKENYFMLVYFFILLIFDYTF